MIELMQRKTYAEGAKVGVSVHNRFDIEVRDALTGELKRSLFAENIVLDQMWTRLCGRSSYFVNIHFGTGTGTLAASRTSLFSHLGTKAVTNDAQSKALPTSYWRQKIVLNPEEYVGSTLTEVGVAYGSTSSYLVTHALLRDMNGNVTSLLKTALDVVTIYATVYVTFSTTNSNLKLCGLSGSNPLINYLIGGTAWPASIYFYAGDGVPDQSNNGYALAAAAAAGTSSALTLTSDVPNKKFYSNTYRFAIDAANGHLTEFGLGSALTSPIFRLRLPATGIYAGLDLSGVSVGTGDGSTIGFTLPSKNVKQSSLIVKVDGSPVSNYTLSDVFESNSGIKMARPAFAGIYDAAAQVDTCHDGSVYAVICFDPGVGVIDFKTAKRTDGIWASLPDPVSFPARYGYAIRLSGNGLALAVGASTSPYVYTYDWNGSAWIKRADPANLPAGSVKGIGLNYDGTIMACAHMNSPYVTTYDWNGSAWIKRNNPANLPSSNGAVCVLSSDGLLLCVGVTSSPYVYTYDWNGSAWIKRADPANLPAGELTAIALSNDKSMLVCGHYTSPYIDIYRWSGSAWVRDANPATLPAGNSPSGLAISEDKTRLYVGMYAATTYEQIIYQWSGSAWSLVSQADLGSSYCPAAASLDGTTAFWGTQFFDMTKRQTKITFDTAPANGAVITADYTVNGIHKTAQRVIDLYAEFVFGEPV